MAQLLRAFIQDSDDARRDLNRFKGKQLQSQKERDNLRLLVERYFEAVRPSIAKDDEQNKLIKQVDKEMQNLLLLCHKRANASNYQRLLASTKSQLVALDAQMVSASALATSSQGMSSVDARIISTLQAIVPAAALSYQQATNDLQGNSRLSWRGPATDLREALRETLDYLAPDDDVKVMPGFRQDPNTSGPTMKQKVRFVLKNRGVSKAVSGTAESAVDAVEESLGAFVRSVYTRSSVSTHTPTDKTEVRGGPGNRDNGISGVSA